MCRNIFLFIVSFILLGCSSSIKTGDIRSYDTIDIGRVKEIPLPQQALDSSWPESFGFGRSASKADIERWDIDVMPDGRGLPKGKGVAVAGRSIYLVKCASCYGQDGSGGTYDVLVSKKGKSIGTYWPYATTLFDYIRRTMPFNMPGSLKDEEVYHLTAYLLIANGLIDSVDVITQKNLPSVKMPALANFVIDDRKGGPEIK